MFPLNATNKRKEKKMITVNSTRIGKEEFDSITEIKFVHYTSEDRKQAKAEKKTIDEFIFDKYNSYGWHCSHDYDCCGCWASFVLSIRTIAKGYKAVVINHLKNV
jgi:hypothetical protein